MRTRRTQSSSNLVSADRHQSVLLHEVITELDLKPSDTVVDATLGGGGHTLAFIQTLDTKGTVIGIDADSEAIERARERIGDSVPTVHLVQENFRNLTRVLEELGIKTIDKALFDLGWSGWQLEANRGFSFQKDEPLLMTYTSKITDETLTARTIVNEWEEEHIADILFGWGEERFARRIARAIVEERETRPIETSKRLAEIVTQAVPGWYRVKKIHPATRTFQALRIAVNDEMGAIVDGLTAALNHLGGGGRIAVITFHSGEDRVVKKLFRGWQDEGKGTNVHKRPLVATPEELEKNPRARSAKLRIFEKTNH